MKTRSIRKKKTYSPLLISSFIFCLCTAALIVFTPPEDYPDVFSTIAETDSYAQSVNELTPMDGLNTIKPSFDSYYATLRLTTPKKIINKISWLLYYTGIVKRPAWSITGFKKLVERITIRNEKKGFKGNFIAKITGSKDDRYIVFGTLQGAFHSLLRDLHYLKDQGIISDTFTIIKPHHYVIIMGEAIDRSAFTLETLSLVMKILEANPDKAIYLRGGHESKNYWQEHTLKTELMIRARDISLSKIPLEKEINRFFNTLPLAFYIGMFPTPTKDFIRISKRGIGSDPLVDERNLAAFLATPHSGIVSQTVSLNDNPANTSVTIRAILKSEKKRYSYQFMEGLRTLPYDTGVTAWTLLSCPTVVYATAKGMKFFFDAFTVITPEEKINDWTISLYRRDRRTNNPFFPKVFNLIAGLEQEAMKKNAPSASSYHTSVGQYPVPTQKTSKTLGDYLGTGFHQDKKTKASEQSNDIFIERQPGSQIPLVSITAGDKPMTVTVTVTTEQLPEQSRKDLK